MKQDDPAVFQITILLGNVSPYNLYQRLSYVKDDFDKAMLYAGKIADLEVRKEQLELIAQAGDRIFNSEAGLSICPVKRPDIDRINWIAQDAAQQAEALKYKISPP